MQCWPNENINRPIDHNKESIHKSNPYINPCGHLINDKNYLEGCGEKMIFQIRVIGSIKCLYRKKYIY